MEFRLRDNNSDISIGKAAAAEKSLKEMTGFDEASLREMYEKNKDVIKKEAIPLALGWAEQEYGKTLVRAVKWAVGGNLEKIVNRLLDDEVQGKFLKLLVSHLKAFLRNAKT